MDLRTLTPEADAAWVLLWVRPIRWFPGSGLAAGFGVSRLRVRLGGKPGVEGAWSEKIFPGSGTNRTQ